MKHIRLYENFKWRLLASGRLQCDVHSLKKISERELNHIKQYLPTIERRYKFQLYIDFGAYYQFTIEGHPDDYYIVYDNLRNNYYECDQLISVVELIKTLVPEKRWKRFTSGANL
jgi:hypothetical protein